MAYGNVFVGDACMVEMSEWGQILLKWGCHFLVFAHICAFRLENFYLHMQAHFFKFLCMCVHFKFSIGHLHLLHILTSVWVLSTTFADENMLFCHSVQKS